MRKGKGERSDMQSTCKDSRDTRVLIFDGEEEDAETCFYWKIIEFNQ